MISSAANAFVRWVGPALTVAAVAAGALQAGPVPTDAADIRLVNDGNPLAGMPFYVDPSSKAMVAAKNSPSPELEAVANTPQAYWLDQAFPAGSVGTTVSRYAGAAQAAGAMPIFSIYALPNRDCGSYAAGGFGSGDSYRAWIDGIAAGVGDRPATFIVEPDAIAMAGCLGPEQRDPAGDGADGEPAAHERAARRAGGQALQVRPAKVPESARGRYDAGATQGTPKNNVSTYEAALRLLEVPLGQRRAHIWRGVPPVKSLSRNFVTVW